MTEPAAAVTVTDQLIDDVQELVQLGVPPLVAVLAQGVSETVFVEWMDRGRRPPPEDDEEEDVDGPYRRLRLVIEQSEARAEAILIGRIRAEAKHNWQAAAWLAERRFPERYVRRSVNAKEDVVGSGEIPEPDHFADIDAAEVVPIRSRRDGR